MKVVFVRPERCVGCRQCELACAVAHSRSQTLAGAVFEPRSPQPRIHIGVGALGEPFPNRCRHCDPAPCQAACLPGALYREPQTGSLLVNPERCIRCASCAMACPFGVIRFYDEPLQARIKVLAHKCDNCVTRRRHGQVPACVEACKAGALLFSELNQVLAAKTREVARSASFGPRAEAAGEPGAMTVLREFRARLVELSEAK